MMTPTADEIETYIAMAEAGLGGRCDAAWVRWCSQTLREMVTEYPQEQQIPLFLLNTATEAISSLSPNELIGDRPRLFGCSLAHSTRAYPVFSQKIYL